MVEAKTTDTSGGQAAAYRTWPPAVAALIAEWRERWPAAFTQPIPLAVGFSGQIKAALRAEGKPMDRKTVGVAIHQWTMQGAYLRAVARGEMRRNLDGSEAGLPDDAARQQAQKLLDERAARRAGRGRKWRERTRNLAAAQAP